MELTQEHYDGGKIAYDAYCKQTGGKSLATGDTLPPFEGLKPAIQDAWAAAYIAVRLNIDRTTRPVLLACRSRFETIKETHPELHLTDDIAMVNGCLGC